MPEAPRTLPADFDFSREEAPATLPADFFSSQGEAPSTLPANFFDAPKEPSSLLPSDVFTGWKNMVGSMARMGQRMQAGVGEVIRGAAGVGEALAADVQKIAPEGSFLSRPTLRDAMAQGTELGSDLTKTASPQLGLEDIYNAEGFWKKVGVAAEAGIGVFAEQIPVMGSMMGAGRIAGGGGIATMSYLINAGNLYADLRDKGVDAPGAALATGIPLALLDAWTPKRLLNKLVFVPKEVEQAAKTPLMKALLHHGKELAKTGLGEGFTEGGQEGLQIALEAYYKVADPAKVNALRVLNAMAAGFVVGGLGDVSTTAVQKSGLFAGAPIETQDPTKPPEPPIEPSPTPSPLPEGPDTPPPPPREPKIEPEGPTLREQTLLQIRGMDIDALKDAKVQVQDEYFKKKIDLELRRRTDVLTELDPVDKQVFDEPPKEIPQGTTVGDLALRVQRYAVGVSQGTMTEQQLTEAATEMDQAWLKSGWDEAWYDTVTKAHRFVLESEERTKTLGPVVLPELKVVRAHLLDIDGSVFTESNQPFVQGELVQGSNVLDGSSPEKVDRIVRAAKNNPAYQTDQLFKTTTDKLESEGKVIYTSGLRNFLSTLGYGGVQFVNQDGEVRGYLVDGGKPVLGEAAQLARFPAGFSFMKEMENFGKARLTDGSFEVPVWSDGSDKYKGYVKEFLRSEVGARIADALMTNFHDAMAHMRDFGHTLTTYDPALIKLIPQTLKGIGIYFKSGAHGAHLPLRSDWTSRILAINPATYAGSYPTPETAAAKMYDTLIHEVAHIFGLHKYIAGPGSTDLSDFPMHLANMLKFFKPIEAESIERIKNAISDKNGGTGFDPDFARNFAPRPKASPGTVSTGGPQTANTGRRKAPDRGKGRGNVGGAVGGTGPAIETETSGGGGLDEELRRAVGDGYRGDFPRADPEYANIARELGRRADNWEPSFEDKRSPEIQDHIDRVEGAFQRALPEGFRKDMINFGKFKAFTHQLVQIALVNPDLEPLQRYLNTVRSKFSRVANEMRKDADTILREWNKIGPKNAQKLVSLIFDVTEDSFKRKARVPQSEILSKAAKLGASQDVLDLYWKIDHSMQSVLGVLQKGLEAQAVKRLGPLAGPALKQIYLDFEMLRNRNYFPFQRFGQYGVQVKALRSGVVWNGKPFGKGEMMYFAAYESKTEQLADRERMRRQVEHLGGWSTDVWIHDNARGFLSFSPLLFDMLVSKLNLSGGQIDEMKDLLYQLAPGHGFSKHLREKSNIAGYSRNAKRAFADYHQHAANHVARLMFAEDLQKAVDDMKMLGKQQYESQTKFGMLSEYMQKHFDMLMNPRTDLAGFKTLMFLLYFGFAPKQAFINMLQVPMFTLPYLQKKQSGLAKLAIAKDWILAQKDSQRSLQGLINLSQEEQDLFDWGYKDGFLDQSYSAELAAVAVHNRLYGKFYTETQAGFMFRRTVEYSTRMFALTEENNRRVTVLAAYRIFRKQGMSIEQARNEARTAVDITQGEYASWNKPMMFRSDKSRIGSIKELVTIFRMYTQNSYFFAGTNQGGLPFYAMMIGMAGLLGLPFVPELFDILGAVLSGLYGRKLDLKEEAMRAAGMFMDNPDLMLYGAARDSFGLSMLGNLVGVPFPSLDFSSSLQLGRILPTEPIIEGIQGTKSPDAAILDSISTVLGVGAGTGISTARALLDDSPASSKWIKRIPVTIFKQGMRIKSVITTGGKLEDAGGNPLINFDFENPAHIGEVIGMALGANPTRLTRRAEAISAAYDTVRYNEAKREALLSSYAYARALPDGQELTRKALAAVIEYNKTAPARFKIRPSQLSHSVKTRVKNRALREAGLPTQREYRDIFKDKMEIYRAPQRP